VAALAGFDVAADGMAAPTKTRVATVRILRIISG
jgi:hypothetical protein